ncbi:hypothetical protein PVAP13_9KG034657 [Panicum virgatum]|uniref:Uncharacterized protein n=1 Tax=Panicum virgatum TaxID=38727 RepID=A0A8T0NAY5_PANVG|nr:hypothetical protein PVAP13_9KG034657 [Panicum virgatum]
MDASFWARGAWSAAAVGPGDQDRPSPAPVPVLVASLPCLHKRITFVMPRRDRRSSPADHHGLRPSRLPRRAPAPDEGRKKNASSNRLIWTAELGSDGSLVPKGWTVFQIPSTPGAQKCLRRLMSHVAPRRSAAAVRLVLPFGGPSRPALSQHARHERRRCRRTWRGRYGTAAWPERPSRRRGQAPGSAAARRRGH